MDDRLNPELAMEYGNVNTVVFWDYASLQIPPYADAKSIVHNLMLKLRQKKCYGHVLTFRLYGTGIQAEHKEAFLRTGIELIDVPSGVQDGVNKRMTVDMLLWTKDNPPPAIVVVISRNRDFVVSTGILTAQGYRVMSADAALNPVERIAIWN